VRPRGVTTTRDARTRAPHATALVDDARPRDRNHSSLIRSLPCTTAGHKFTKGKLQ